MSYRTGHIKSKISGIRPKISVFKKLWFWIAILAFLIIVGSAYFLLFYPGIQINKIIISGNEKISSQELVNFISGKSKVVFLKMEGFEISTNSIFLLRGKIIEQNILESYSVAEEVVIKRKLPQTVLINVVERKPFGVFCADASQNNCFLLDYNGIIFEGAANIPPEMAIVRLPSEQKSFAPGQEALDEQVVGAIRKINQYVQDGLKIELKEFLVTSPIRVNITTGEGWKIYFDLTEDIRSQTAKLEALLKEGGLVAEKRLSLKYIDLRPKGKAIVCDSSLCE